jgi:tetratricopeptide (TPR) repeat protein
MPASSAYKLPACLLLLLAAAFVAFGAVIPGEFVVDDKLWAVPQSSAPGGAAQVMQTFGTWVYRPLHGLFLNAAMMLVGSSAAALHCLSIAVHGANSILLFLLLGRLLPQLPLPLRLAAGLLFAVHPAGSEAVLWISAMAELTAMLAMLATLLLYLHWRQAWSPLRVGVIGISFLAAYLFKESAIMLPLVVVAYELAQDRGERRLPKMLVAAVLLAPPLFLLIRYVTLGSLAGGLQLSINPGRVIELALAHLRFIWLPAAPSFALRPPEVPLAAPSAVAAALALLAAAVFLCWRLKADRGVWVLGLAWLGLGLWPAYAVALVGEGFFNSRQAYIPSAGVSFLIGALLTRLPAIRQRAALAPLGLMLLWMAYGAVGNAFVWRTNLDVYRQAVGVSPAADGPRAGVANALQERGDNGGALAMYREALDRAASPQARGEYLYAMASILGQSGRNAESEQMLQELVRMEPRNSPAWAGLGNNAWMGGRIDEAAEYYRRAVELNPGNFEAVSNLATMLTASGPAHAAEAARWRSRAQALAARHLKPQGLR